MKDILPVGSDGIVLVVENECSPSFTYEINGPEVRYLGGGDHHDSSFDYLQLSSDLLDLREFAIKDSSYSGSPVLDDFCKYTVRVFPSQTNKSRFTTNNGILFACVAGLIFFLTSLVFILYDVYVERRQTKVYRKAMKTEAIVSSLFPSNVRQRMEEVQEAPTALRGFQDRKSAETPNTTGSPIADLFPETSIFFADIAYVYWNKF